MNKQMIQWVLFSLIVAALLVSCGSDSKANESDIAPGTTALSIVYASSEEVAGKIVGHYRVHAVDDNGNPISGLKLKMSLINGVKQIRNQKLQRGTGSILSSEPIMLKDVGVDFTQTNVRVGDSLIILPSSGKTDINYLGDWTISNIESELELKENSYNLESTENLTYIIGNEERLLGGENGDRGIIAVAHIQDINNTSVTNEKGFTFFDIVFDPILAGHTVTVGVHTVKGTRLGAAKVIALRGADFPPVETSIINSGETVVLPMTLSIDTGNGSTEHLIDVEINPLSFIVGPGDACTLDFNRSIFHTDSGGRVILVIDTKGKADENATTKNDKVEGGEENATKAPDKCIVKWDGGVASTYLEY